MDWRQTLWTLIRLLLIEQSDLGPYCLQYKRLKCMRVKEQTTIVMTVGIRINLCLKPSRYLRALPVIFSHYSNILLNLCMLGNFSWFLAHLSRRLRGELLVYQWLCRRSVNIFKHLLLWNHWANWTQISYGDSLGWGNESLFKWSWSHDQDGHHAHIW